VALYAVIGGKMLGVLKIQLRLAKLSNEMNLDRDFICGINIELRFHSDGRPVALVSTGPYGVLVNLLIPDRESTTSQR